MSSSPLVTATAILCCLATGPVTAQIPDQATSAPQRGAMQVTTDTPEYCLHLLDRVSDLVRTARSQPPQEVSVLATEGQRMCDHGQTRGGIMRLRRALMLMMSDER